MKCPACGLYHPAFYERCVACGTSFSSTPENEQQASQEATADIHRAEAKSSFAPIKFRPSEYEGHFSGSEEPYEAKQSDLKSTLGRLEQITSMSNKRGVFIALLILVLFAGATAFFFSRSPDDQRLLALGKHQLSLGQYAFAVQTLSKVSSLKPNDPNVFLALARAYIGVDQVSEAWDCITHAQQLGVGVVADPALASELANYYKQHSQYEKAIDLLRPLANAAVPGKKAELADLDALRGDDCIEKGKLDEAKRDWEEVQQLNVGSRSSEAKSRLATIYLKLVDIAYANQDDAKALDYLNKVNSLEENPRNYLLAADICERDGKLKEAIDQVQKAVKIKSDDQFVKSRLAQLYLAEGKELIQLGNEDEGYGYIQQAGTLDPAFSFPAAIIKNLNIHSADSNAKITGELWNPSSKNISSLTMKVQLCNDSTGQTLWQKEQRIIDDFVAPLPPKQTKAFNFSAPNAGQKPETLAFKIYLDGNYYGEYPLKKGARSRNDKPSAPMTNEQSTVKSNTESQSKKEGQNKSPAENSVGHASKNETEPITRQIKKSGNDSDTKDYVSPEEKTMKDLEF